jgi:hypothetical protein
MTLPRLTYIGGFQNTPLLDLLLSGSAGQELPTKLPVRRRQWWPRDIARRAIA